MILHHHYESAKATIVSHKQGKLSFDANSATYDFVVDVMPTDGEPFRTLIKEPLRPDGNFMPPAPGHVVAVLFDPRDQHTKFDMSDPQLSIRQPGWQNQQKHQQQDDLAAKPGTPPTEPR